MKSPAMLLAAGADGKTMYDGEFSTREQDRLDKLKASIQ